MNADADQRRAPQRLLARAIKGYEEGVISAQAIATLRGITLDIADRDLGDAGIEPVKQPVAWADPAELPDVPIDAGPGDAGDLQVWVVGEQAE